MESLLTGGGGLSVCPLVNLNSKPSLIEYVAACINLYFTRKQLQKLVFVHRGLVVQVLVPNWFFC